jgi:phage shock protein A
MTDSNNYSFANYNSLVENTEASGNAVTDALVRTIRVVHQLANSAAKHETHVKNAGEILANVLTRIDRLESGAIGLVCTDQKQQEDFTENTINRLGSLETWRSEISSSYRELTDSFTSLKHSVEVHAGRFTRSDQHIQEWAGTLKDKERHAVENLEALRSKIEKLEKRIEEWRFDDPSSAFGDNLEALRSKIEKLEGRDDPSSTFGDNVLASLQQLREGGQICELFGGDMAEIARDEIGNTDFADNVENALNNMSASDIIDVSDLDGYDLWYQVKDYVEDYVDENAKGMDSEEEHTLTCAANTAEYNAEKIAVITSRLKQVGIALDPKDRSLYGDNRTKQEAHHDAMRVYSDFRDDNNRRLLAEFANDLLDAQNKEEEPKDAKTDEG